MFQRSGSPNMAIFIFTFRPMRGLHPARVTPQTIRMPRCSRALRAPSGNAHGQWPAGSGLPAPSFPFSASSDTPPRTVKSTGA
jgi:hypothetical protein